MFDTIEEILLPKILNDPKNVSRHCIVGVFTTSKCQVGLRLSSSVCVLICLVLAIFVFLYWIGVQSRFLNHIILLNVGILDF